MDRRQFIVSNSSFVDRARDFIKTCGEPLLEYPETIDREVLVVSPFGFSLNLHVGWGPAEIPPAPSYRTWLAMNRMHPDYEFEDITADQFDDPIPPRYWEDCWFSTFCPSVLAFFYLQPLDLGPPTGSPPNSEVAGEIYFSEGEFPGCDARVVGIEDLLSISLLQNRLNVLGENTAVNLDKSAREYFKSQRERDVKSLQPEHASVAPIFPVNHRGNINQGETR